MDKELKNKLINLLEEREEVASEFQDRHDDGEWEKTQNLAMKWWTLSSEIDDVKKEIARSVRKSNEKLKKKEVK